MEQEEQQDQNVEVFAEKVREHILKDHFLNALDQQTPQTRKGTLDKSHPKSEFLLKFLQNKPNKFVDQNNMRISAFHTSLVQGKSRLQDSSQLYLKEENLKPKAKKINVKQESELKLLNSVESLQKKMPNPMTIELGNMEKQLYDKMEKMQIQHKQTINEVILQKNKVVEDMQGKKAYLQNLVKLIHILKGQTTKVKKSLIKRVKRAEETVLRIPLFKSSDTDLEIFKTSDFSREVREKIFDIQDIPEVGVVLEKAEIILAEKQCQTICNLPKIDLGKTKEYSYQKKKPKLKLESHEYTYTSGNSFEIQIKTNGEQEPKKYNFRDRNKLENEIIQSKLLLNKENLKTHNVPKSKGMFNSSESLLRKREFDNSSLGENKKYVNQHSILNLNKRGAKVESSKKEITEFRMYPKRTKKEKLKRKTPYENSVRIRNLVEVKSAKKGSIRKSKNK